MRLIVLALAGLGAIAAPALAVGLGPLSASGITDGPRKGFYLTVINPYPGATKFQLSSFMPGDHEIDPRVTIFPSSVVLGGGRQRKVLVVADGLVPGETHNFRVCAEQPPQPTEMVHARVCSTLSARRILVR